MGNTGALVGGRTEEEIHAGGLLLEAGKIFTAHVGRKIGEQKVLSGHRGKSLPGKIGQGNVVDDGTGTTTHPHVTFSAENCGGGFGDLLDALQNEAAGLGGIGAQGAVQLHLLGDNVEHIAAADAADGQRRRLGGGNLPGQNLLQVDHDVGGDGDGIHAFFGGGSVAALATDGQKEVIGRSHHVAGLYRKGTRRNVRTQQIADVAAKGGVHPFHDALFYGKLGAGNRLFVGLEQKPHSAAQLRPVVQQHPDGAQQHGGVGIVAAGVHLAVMLRGEGQAGGFLNGQGIHVSAQQHRLAGQAAHNVAPQGGVGGGQGVGKPPAVQYLADIGLGQRQLGAHLRDTVQIAAKGYDVLLQGFALFPHISSPQNCRTPASVRSAAAGGPVRW